MIKLLELLEASYANDRQKEQQADQILNQLKTALQNRKFTEYSDNGLGVKLGDLTIVVYSGNWGRLEATQKYGYVPDAVFEPREKIIKTYKNNVNIKVNPITVQFNDEQQIKHELVHYLDSKQIGNAKMANRSRGHGQELAKLDSNTTRKDQLFYYYNTPEEFNAHWFQYIMPVANAYLDKSKELPDFNSFRQAVYANPQSQEFVGYLNPKNKQKFDKRLGVYYQGIKDELAGKPLNATGFKVYKSPSFLNKIKGWFKRAA